MLHLGVYFPCPLPVASNISRSIRDIVLMIGYLPILLSMHRYFLSVLAYLLIFRVYLQKSVCAFISYHIMFQSLTLHCLLTALLLVATIRPIWCLAKCDTGSCLPWLAFMNNSLSLKLWNFITVLWWVWCRVVFFTKSSWTSFLQINLTYHVFPPIRSYIW